MADTPANQSAQSTPPTDGPDGQQVGDTSATPPAQSQGQQGQSAVPATSQPESSESSEQQEPGQGLENASHADLVSQIRELRRENAKDRTNAKETAADEARNEVVQSIGKALGIIEDGGDTPDADKLTEQLTEQTNTAKQAQLELAVYKAAADPELGADAAALLDSRSFLEEVQGLDPTKTEDLVSAIKTAVKDNPRLQTTTGQAPGKRSSAPLNQGNQIPVAETPEELAKLIPRQY